MKKLELIEKVAEEANINHAAATRAVNAMFSTLTDAILIDGKATLVGFGSFSLKERAARKARNPQTGETVDVPAKKTIRFQPGKSLRERLNS